MKYITLTLAALLVLVALSGSASAGNCFGGVAVVNGFGGYGVQQFAVQPQFVGYPQAFVQRQVVVNPFVNRGVVVRAPFVGVNTFGRGSVFNQNGGANRLGFRR